MKLKNIIKMGMLITISTMVVACSNQEEQSSNNQEVESTNNNLKIGLMPAVDTAPIFVAQENGYFEELGIDVELEVYTNAQNRQSALQSNSIDGAMTDFIALATNVNGGFEIKATTMTDAVFPILANEGAKDKKDIKVGMMEVSVSNYLVDKWLGQDYNIEKVFIDEIPARLSAIASKELDMGLFPEPVASNGELQGLEKNIYGMDDEYSPDCMVFTEESISEKSDAIEKFHEAYDKAVEDINKDPQIARDILVENIPNISEEAKELMVLPGYKKASLPSEEYVQEIIDWTQETLKKEIEVSPEELLDTQFTK